MLKLFKKFRTLFKLLRMKDFDGIKVRILNMITFGLYGRIYNGGIDSPARLQCYYKIEKEFSPFVEAYVKTPMGGGERSKHDNIIWWCWLQGIDNAPEICKACLHSWQKFYPDKKIITVDEKNIFDYISLPGYIIDKYNKGIFSPTHYSDIVRIELLYTHGGVWTDSTILCTGRRQEYERVLNLPLFVFKRSNSAWWRWASWFMVSDKQNPIIELTRELFFEYWKKYDYTIDYFVVMMFLTMAAQKYKDIWAQVPYYHADVPLLLEKSLYNDYSDDIMNEFKSASDFHKLTYKLQREPSQKSFYRHIINTEK